MKSNKLLIKAVKCFSIVLLLLTILDLGWMIFALLQYLEKEASYFWFGLPEAMFIVWDKLLLVIALLGGIQILLLVARNQRRFKKFISKSPSTENRAV